MAEKDYPEKIKTMLQSGKDPKDLMIQVCSQGCKKWEDKLKRCETALKNMTHVDAEMTW